MSAPDTPSGPAEPSPAAAQPGPPRPVQVIPGRACDGCNVCCVSLTIDDPELRKPQGFRCRNALADNSCAIYAARPRTCRSFECGWRQLRWVRETLRPDRSGVLVRLHQERSATRGEAMGIAISLLTPASLKAEGLAETVAAAVAANLPVYLHVPGPPGYTDAQARINEVLEGPVAARDKAAVLDVLRRARLMAKGGKRDPVTFSGPPPD